MKCPKCESEVKKADKFCSSCGFDLSKKKDAKKGESKKSAINQDEIFNKIGDNLEKSLDTEDTSKDYTKKDINDNKGLAILSYLGPLALIPYFYNKGSKYVKYHAAQGLNLLIIWIIYTITAAILSSIKITKSCNNVLGWFTNCTEVTPWWISFIIDVIGLMLFAIAVVGVVYAITGVAKKLPIVDKVNIIKEKE